jgi:hypothetical protein
VLNGKNFAGTQGHKKFSVWIRAEGQKLVGC